MKKSAAVLSVIAALGVGFCGGYFARGSSAPDTVMAAVQTPPAISRSVAAEETPSPRPSSTPSPTAVPAPTSTPSTYIINKKSRVFHLPSCSSVRQMNEANRITRTDVLREDLMESGYQRCTRCMP